MPKLIHELDVVALVCDLADKGLVVGQVGTVIQELADDHFEVEFSDDQGRTYATAALRGRDLIVLHYAPVVA